MTSELRKIRMQRNLRLKDVAEAVRISARTLSRYENLKQIPQIDVVLRLGAYYGLLAEDLYSLTSEELAALMENDHE